MSEYVGIDAEMADRARRVVTQSEFDQSQRAMGWADWAVRQIERPLPLRGKLMLRASSLTMDRMHASLYYARDGHGLYCDEPERLRKVRKTGLHAKAGHA